MTALIAVAVLSIFIELPGLSWLTGLGPGPESSFNIDDTRFVQAARDFGSVHRILGGYPFFQTVQLFLVGKLIEHGLGTTVNYAVLIRVITIAYAQASLLLTYFLGRRLGLDRLGSVLGAMFLACAPLFVVLANQGTADVVGLVAFYSAILAGMRARSSRSFGWFVAASALAGWAMAVKFLLPVMVIPLLLMLSASPQHRLKFIVVAPCVGLAAFSAASLFAYSIRDLWHLLKMLAGDNLLVGGGKPPFQQLPLYLAELVSASGVLVALAAIAGAFMLLHRTWLLRRQNQPTESAGRVAWLKQPIALLILPLLAQLVLITIAQVHFTRHVLVFVPLVCIAASATVGVFIRPMLVGPRSARHLAAAAVTVVAIVLIGLNAWATGRQYANDPRTLLAARIARLPGEVSTLNFYSQVHGTRLERTMPSGRWFTTCDREFQRFLDARDAKNVLHASAWGGQKRLDFYHRLFSGRSAFRKVATFRRPPFSIEERLARVGLLLPVDTFAAGECVLFQRKA